MHAWGDPRERTSHPSSPPFSSWDALSNDRAMGASGQARHIEAVSARGTAGLVCTTHTDGCDAVADGAATSRPRDTRGRAYRLEPRV
jgi:hypothetical protein